MENILDFEADYRATVDHYPNRWPRPVIGITGNYGPAGCELAEGYWRSIELAGGSRRIGQHEAVGIHQAHQIHTGQTSRSGTGGCVSAEIFLCILEEIEK